MSKDLSIERERERGAFPSNARERKREAPSVWVGGVCVYIYLSK